MVNPYQAPAPGVGHAMDLSAMQSGFALADVGTRFVGSLVDGLFYAGVCIPGFVAVALAGDDGGPLLIAGWGLIGFGVLVLAGLQWYLIATTGQSIAKRMLRMRIVRTNGMPVNFVHGVLLRNWVIALLSNIPLVGGMIALVDALMIFGNERRCLHDKIADTTVIKV